MSSSSSTANRQSSLPGPLPSTGNLPSDLSQWPPHILQQAIAMLATQLPQFTIPGHTAGADTSSGPPIDPALIPQQAPPPPPGPLLSATGLWPAIELDDQVLSGPSSAGNKRTERSADTGMDADSEGETEEPRPKRPRRSRKPASARTPKKLLCDVPIENLTDRQLEVRRELQKFVRLQMQSCTGITATSFPDPTTSNKMLYNFSLRVDDYPNSAIIARASSIVYDEQSNPAKCTLAHKNVPFTKEDIEGFSKQHFRTWRDRYQGTVSPIKAAKQEKNDQANRRAERQRRLCDDRMMAAEEYQRRHARDVLPLLDETAWMSQEESSWEGPEDRSTGESVWERVRPKWRSDEYNGVMSELDMIRRQQRAASRRRPQPMTRRVDFGRTSLDLDPPFPAPFPFMIDQAWLDNYKVEKPNSEVVTRANNPHGFGVPPESTDT